ncbi:MAG: hypothetical protein ABEJ03_03865 [Candidatus Nanohaloarchaea archaeon]
MPDVFSKIYLKYDRDIKPMLKDLSGATRLSFLLYSLAEKNIDKVSQEPDPVFDMEWDNLIILDACRFDLFKEVYEGDADSRISVGSSTLEYVEKTFSKGDYNDTVYVTGNPHFHKSQFRNLTERNVEDVFHSIFHTYQNDWDEDENTVLPDSLIRDAKTAKSLFANKKLVVHFMQPHYPFVNSDMSKGGIDPELEGEDESVWRKAEKGIYARDQAWQGYKKNLEFVIDRALELAEDLEGRTLVTSDHGNLVGENGLYGHPSRGKAKALRRVPSIFVD